MKCFFVFQAASAILQNKVNNSSWKNFLSSETVGLYVNYANPYLWTRGMRGRGYESPMRFFYILNYLTPFEIFELRMKMRLFDVKSKGLI